VEEKEYNIEYFNICLFAVVAGGQNDPLQINPATFRVQRIKL